MAVKVLWREAAEGRVKSELVQGILRVTCYGVKKPPEPPPPNYKPTHYVSKDGDDSQNGSRAQPWRTIAKANEILRAGDVVALGPGTYNESIEPTRDGTATKPIVYTTSGAGEVIIAGKPGIGKLAKITKSYIHLHNLTLSYGHGKADGADWPWVQIRNGVRGCLVYGCRIIRPGDPERLWGAGYREYGIAISGAHSNTIENNYIQGMMVGINLKDSPTKNILRNNTISGSLRHAVSFFNGANVIQGTLIENNLFEHSWKADGCQCVNPDNTADPDPATDNRGIIFRNNLIRHCGENALDLKSSRYILVEGNVFYGALGSDDGPVKGWDRDSMGTIVVGARTTAADIIIRRNVFFDTAPGVWLTGVGFHVYNNTFAGCNRDYTGGDSDWTTAGRRIGFYAVRQRTASAKRCTVVNNIMVGHNSAEFGLLDNDSSPGQYYDHNLYYNSRGGARLGLIDASANSWSAKTLGQWKSHLSGRSGIAGKEAHSIEADPQFVDAKERPIYTRDLDDSEVQRVSDLHRYLDFHLRPGSPAINRGGPLTFANGSGTNSKELRVDDATLFCDGFGVTDGDLVQVGANAPVRVTEIDYDRDRIMLDEPISWSDKAPVFLGDFGGSAPDVGAFQHSLA